jgi:hypothetical protein
MYHRPVQVSWLDRIKGTLISVLPFPAETLLVVAGLGCYLGTCVILRRPLSWAWALVPGLCLALTIEAWEIWDHWSAPGLSVRGQVLAILGRHMKDVLVMNLPAVAVFATALWLERATVR